LQTASPIFGFGKPITGIPDTFELNNSDTIPWEERIKWTEMEYELLGVTKRYTVVEMQGKK